MRRIKVVKVPTFDGDGDAVARITDALVSDDAEMIAKALQEAHANQEIVAFILPEPGKPARRLSLREVAEMFPADETP